ncbi:MAG: PorV/PorQ family protein [candidate division WOR-3 bacterium]
MIKIILILILNQGEIIFPLLRVGIGARPSALGESFTGIYNDIQGVWWNPASNAFVKEKGAFFSYNHWFLDFKDFYSGIFIPLKYINTELSFLYSGTKDIELRDVEGNYTGKGEQIAYVAQFSLSSYISNYFIPGINFKYLYERLPQVEGMGACFDLGFITRISKDLSFGFVIKNFGWNMKYGNYNYPLPFEIKTGIYQRIKEFSGIFLDLTFPRGKRYHINTGIELWIKEVVALRMGYRFIDEINKFTFGGGIRWKNITFDYAFADYGKLGLTHRVSTSFLIPEHIKITPEKRPYEGIIEGRVYDAETGEDLNAVVIYEGKISGESQTIKGKYSIPRLPAGKYHLKVIPENKIYFSQEKETNVLPERKIEENFGLFKKEQKLIIHNIYFETGKAEIIPISYPIIDEIGNILLMNPELKIEIEGHTDNVPVSTPEFPSNLELSKARAEAVKRYIVNKFKIDPERIKTVGYGDTKPVASNETEEGRALNRRIEIKLLK